VSIGCYAMTDPAMEEIWTLMAAAFRNGQREIQVQLLPFRLSEEALERHRGDQWYDFWADLKRGSDLFEQASVPPRVEIRDGRYRFIAASR
jgi:murein L,D-transpeptidase YafK